MQEVGWGNDRLGRLPQEWRLLKEDGGDELGSALAWLLATAEEAEAGRVQAWQSRDDHEPWSKRVRRGLLWDLCGILIKGLL